MKKKVVVLMGILAISASMLFAGCGSSKSVSVGDGRDTEESTKKEYDTEEEPETEYIPEEETEENNFNEHEDWETYYGSGYSIQLSDDWEEVDVAGTEYAFTHLSTAADGFAENITTTTQDISAYNMDIEQYKDLSLQQLEQLGYDVVETESLKLNGTFGYYVLSIVEQQGITCYVAQWFTVVDDTAYIFTAACDEDGYYAIEDEIDEILETFVVY